MHPTHTRAAATLGTSCFASVGEFALTCSSPRCFSRKCLALVGRGVALLTAPAPKDGPRPKRGVLMDAVLLAPSNQSEPSNP